MELLNNVASLLPKRDINGNKGTFGKVLIIAGSKNMVGCCSLAALGALRSGAGLVKLCFPDCLYTALTTKLSEPVFMPVETNEQGFISHLALGEILDEAQKCDAVLLGCGIGVGYSQSLLTTSLITQSKTPLILDADALNNLAPCVNILLKRKCSVLLTPHPGEMARLVNSNIDEVEKNREKVITDFCNKYNVNVLLKGHQTLISNENSNKLYINNTGNSGLSKGGSGDLLSGIITALTPQLKGDLFSAAALGAYIHGLSADVLKSEMSEYSILPADCANALGKVFKIIEESGMN